MLGVNEKQLLETVRKNLRRKIDHLESELELIDRKLSNVENGHNSSNLLSLANWRSCLRCKR